MLSTSRILVVLVCSCLMKLIIQLRGMYKEEKEERKGEKGRDDWYMLDYL